MASPIGAYVPYGFSPPCELMGCSKLPAPDTVEHAGYSPYVMDLNKVSMSTLYNAGGYAQYVDTQTLLQPRLEYSNGHRCKWVYLQNYGGMQPHYGQQYPDRQPTGLNEVNGRAWRRNRPRNVVKRSV